MSFLVYSQCNAQYNVRNKETAFIIAKNNNKKNICVTFAGASVNSDDWDSFFPWFCFEKLLTLIRSGPRFFIWWTSASVKISHRFWPAAENKKFRNVPVVERFVFLINSVDIARWCWLGKLQCCAAVSPPSVSWAPQKPQWILWSLAAFQLTVL